jgi:putative hydrolase of the HAD superfamily
MPSPTVVLWDIGGVLLSNGWEEPFRRAAAARFGYDAEEYERRHAPLDAVYERGEITLDQYLDRVLFYEPRPFSRREYIDYMFGCTTPHPATLALAERVRATGAVVTSCLNNEGREFNEFRIARFGLYRLFTSFFSSCYTGRRKPDPPAYQLVLDVLRRTPEDVLFIDDRTENLTPARALGMQTIHYQDPVQLERDLARLGVSG